MFCESYPQPVTNGVFQGLLDFFTQPPPTEAGGPSALAIAPRESVVTGPAPRVAAATNEITFERSAKAKNYRLTLRKDGVAVATIPARGTERDARVFVAQNADWLARARERQSRKPRAAQIWTIGTEVLWRGELREVRKALEGERPCVCLGADIFRVAKLDGDLRATLEAHFLRVAKIELPGRTWELAAETRMAVREVTVRNQRTRWGSCTTTGVISLNWRLVQAPETVRDYVIYHELMHLREMNHSDRFWRRVEEVYPDWRDAERWLKGNGSLLGL